jgi:hypothetical protein
LAAPLVQVRGEPPGQFTAQVPGIAELSATATTREQAVGQLRRVIAAWLSSGRLVALPVSVPSAPIRPPNWAKEDPLEQEFMEELARIRQIDFELTLREYEQEDRACPSSSSTPTT